MKKIIGNILIVLVFLLGLGLICYPTLSNWYNEQVGSYSMRTYQEVVDNTPYELYETILEDARAYNAGLNATTPTYVSGAATDETYRKTLDLVDGIMGALVIDKIGVNLPIYHGTDESVLQHAIGHLEGSSVPTGENNEHTALTGHTGLPSATLLTDLVKMELEDTFQITLLNQIFTYQVYNIIVVEPTELEALLPVADKNLVTLITCTPYGVNSHRLLVQGELIKTETIAPDLVTDTLVGEDDAITAQSQAPDWVQNVAMVVAKTLAESLHGFAVVAERVHTAWLSSGHVRWELMFVISIGLLLLLLWWVWCALHKQNATPQSDVAKLASKTPVIEAIAPKPVPTPVVASKPNVPKHFAPPAPMKLKFPMIKRHRAVHYKK